jgi:transcriptional regulator with XRE-family HTH domain
VDDFPTDAYLRAARLFADVSQRELAEAAGLSPWVVARLESEPQHARVQTFARALDACGLRLSVTVVKGGSYEFASECIPADGERRDRSGRRFPAHLDVRPARLGWWGSGWPMFQGREPEFTFDRARWRRDERRERMVKQYFEQWDAAEAQRDAAEAQRDAAEAQREGETKSDPG